MVDTTTIVKIGNVELTEAEAEEMYFNHKYIVQYRKIYQLGWCENYINPDGTYGGVYGTLIYTSEKPLTKRGRFFALTAAEVNDLLGFKILIER